MVRNRKATEFDSQNFDSSQSFGVAGYPLKTALISKFDSSDIPILRMSKKAP